MTARIRRRLADAEAGLLVAEYDLTPFVEAIQDLQQWRAWETLFSDEPKTWARLVMERLDPQSQRLTWIESLLRGYAELQRQGYPGRIHRRLAEKAVGYAPLPSLLEAVAPATPFANPASTSDAGTSDAGTSDAGPTFAPPPDSFTSLQKLWLAATPEERQAFLRWLQTEKATLNLSSTDPPAAPRPAPLAESA